MSLSTNYTFVGKGNWSLDGVGGQATSGGTISADVPEGSRVEAAYFYGTTFTTIPNAITSVDIARGSDSLTLGASDFTALGITAGLQAYRSDVTTFFREAIDDGDASVFDFTVSNITGSGIDGFTLVVVYSNPDEDTRTISLLDGFSATSGDDFELGFSEPVDTDQAGFEALMSLGIGFGFQQNGEQQFSRITIDGRQLTTSAGGSDDGAATNGGLVTIGGLGDSSANPDPDALTTGARTDDELYDLAQGNATDATPYLPDGATGIAVTTINPSNNDNIFFAGFNITAIVAVDTDENDAPIAVSDSASVDEDGTVTFSVVGNDFDPDNDSFSLASFDATGLQGSLTSNGDGTFTYDPNGAFDGLGESESATTTFSYRISDGELTSSSATVTITINGVGDGGPTDPKVPNCPVVTRAGTLNGSAATNDTLTGVDYHNSFYFDVGVDSGNDTITNFQKVDVLVTNEALEDRNNDGIIGFGKNGRIDLDGLGGSSDLVTVTGVNAVRYLGESCEGVYVYADASVRLAGMTEGTLANDTLAGDAADAVAQVFFFDTALDIDLGDDTINGFGAGDTLVTTSMLWDRDNDGVVTFGGNALIDLSGGTGGPGDPGAPGEVGSVAMFDTEGVQITSLVYDGSETINGVTYYTYSLPAEV